MTERGKLVLPQLVGLVGLVALASIVLWPVIGSPYSGDDTFDSLHPMNLHFSGQSPWSLIWDITDSWRANQGRFFPGAVTIGVSAHYFLSNVAIYKAAQLVVVLVCVALFVVLVRLVTRSGRVAILCGLFLVAAFQFRVQYDPILQFSLQQPSLMILMLTTCILAVVGSRQNNHVVLLLAALIYSCALLTYETTVLLSPAVVALVILENRRQWIRRSVYFFGPAMLAVGNLLYLRGQVETSAPGYTSNLEPDRVIPTFFRQASGALPLSYAQLNTPPFIQRFPRFLDVQELRSWAVAGLVITLGIAVLKKLPPTSTKTLVVMGFVGFSFWFLPALVVSQTVRWQDEVVLGNAYIPVYLEYFGAALVFAAGILLIRKLLIRRSTVWRSVGASLTVVFLVLGTLASTSNNRLAVAQYFPGYKWPRQFLERGIERGAFAKIVDGSKVLTPAGQHWHTAPFVYWWGGPKLAAVTQPYDPVPYQSCLTDVVSCSAAHNAAFVPFGLYPSEIRALMVGTEFRIDGGPEGITSLRMRSPTVYVELLRTFGNTLQRETRCRKWLAFRLKVSGIEVSPSQVDVVRSASNWCVLNLVGGPEFEVLGFTTRSL